jgi:hypothetical protein
MALFTGLGSQAIVFRCENHAMSFPKFACFSRALATYCLEAISIGLLAAYFLAAAPASAQEANVLGLPAIPQPKPGSSAAAASAAAKSGTAAPTAAPPSRQALAGELGLQHSTINGVGRLVVTTRATFATAGAKSNAVDAARDVQKEVGKACGRQCKPEKMKPPTILPTGQLEFELAFSPLHQHLNQAQFLAILQSQPLNLTAAQRTPPAQGVPPAASVTTAPAATGVTADTSTKN